MARFALKYKRVISKELIKSYILKNTANRGKASNAEAVVFRCMTKAATRMTVLYLIEPGNSFAVNLTIVFIRSQFLMHAP